jgi:hypothetical protein
VVRYFFHPYHDASIYGTNVSPTSLYGTNGSNVYKYGGFSKYKVFA